jgi:glycosyltransferase involved in cell wall biosynthesis
LQPLISKRDCLQRTSAPELERRRLLVVEEGLRDVTGHWFEYVKSVATLHRELGAEVTVAGHFGVTSSVCAALDAREVFHHSNWDGIYAHPRAWQRYLGITHHNWRVAAAMDRFFAAEGPFDCVFVPTVAIHHIGAWRYLAWRHLSRSMRRLVLFFRNNVARYDPDSDDPKFGSRSAVWRRVLLSFEPLIRTGQVCFATDSDRLAKEYEILCGMRPIVLPSPRIADFFDRPATLDPSAPYVFGCLGPPRFEKGIDLLQSAVERFLATRPDARAEFVIQWNQPIYNKNGSGYLLSPALEADPRVRLLTRALESVDYDLELRRIDCMVLPYRRQSYFARISGVAIEAVTSGIPVVFTENTWMADFVNNLGAGVSMRNDDVASLHEALNTAYDQRERLAQNARSRTQAARHAHAGDRFVEQLWSATCAQPMA